jgi:hypothetical protein
MRNETVFWKSVFIKTNFAWLSIEDPAHDSSLIYFLETFQTLKNSDSET